MDHNIKIVGSFDFNRSQDLASQSPRPHLVEAIRLLSEAYEYAEELGQDAWSFAVESEVLRSVNATNSDLRWLTWAGYVKHGLEITEPGDAIRSFCHMPPTLLAPRSCFVLTAAGAEATTKIQHQPAAVRIGNVDGASQRPIWDGDRRQIRLGSAIVKEFKVPAPNQETILAAFQEEGWPPRIDDPLSPIADVEPRRRLHDTIKALNGKQSLAVLRFMGDGNGEGVRWELRASRCAGLAAARVGPLSLPKVGW